MYLLNIAVSKAQMLQVANIDFLIVPKVPNTCECQFPLRINPLVPRVQKIKIRNSTLNRLLIVEFVKKMSYFGAHYSERQGLMG